MKKGVVFLFILAMPIWSACSSSYSLKKHNDKLNRHYIELKMVAEKINKAIEKDIEIYLELKRVLQKPELFPYPSLSQLTQDMEKVLPAVKKHLLLIATIMKKLKALDKTYPSIEDSSPEYQQASQLTKQFYKIFTSIQSHIKKLYLLHKNFHSLLKEYSIRRLSLKNQYDELKKLIALSRQKTAVIQINSMRIQRKYPNEMDIQKDFKKLFKAIAQLQNQLIQEKKRFETYYLKQNYFWTGPGLKNIDGFISEAKTKLNNLIQNFEVKMQAF